MKFVKIVDPWLMERFPNAQVYTSLEGENEGGSIKDHMIRKGLEDMVDAGLLGGPEKRKEISEITAGSAGVSLAHHAKKMGIKCHIFLPNTASDLIKNELQSLGATVHLLDISTAYEDYSNYIETNGIIPFNQMFDLAKAKYYEEIGEKFINTINFDDISVLGSVGTGHSLEGIGNGAKGLKITCEPSPGLEVNGVRNIEEQQLGEKDPCILRSFDERLIIGINEFYPEKTIFTDCGQVEIGDSFRLVLGGCSRYLTKNPKSTIFAIGAKNRKFLL